MADRFYEKETGNLVHAYQVPDRAETHHNIHTNEALVARPGDWVVDYGSGHVDVVDDESFTEDYEGA